MNKYRLFASVAAMLAVAACFLGGVLWQLGFFRHTQHWTIATGGPAGTYYRLGQQLTEMLDVKLAPWDRFRMLTSAGSAENMSWIGDGRADFAFVQSNAKVAENARLVATLYDEVLHILVRKAAIQSEPNSVKMPLEILSELGSVSLGQQGSGTSQVATMLLDHFEVTLKSPPKHLSTSQLKAKFLAGELDAAFVLAAPGSPSTEELLDSAGVELLSLGEGPQGGSPSDAIAALHPAFQPRLIPARLYGKLPNKAIRTVGVSALLVASESVDSAVVRRVTNGLFSHRNQLLVGDDTPLALDTETSRNRNLIPMHEGAEAFYRRDNPSFLVVYAEVIALGLTLMVGLWTIARLFVRWLSDVKKERIDQFICDVREAAELDASARLSTLRAIHERAFDQLMQERLIANESFVIFHDYLLNEISRAERGQSMDKPK